MKRYAKYQIVKILYNNKKFIEATVLEPAEAILNEENMYWVQYTNDSGQLDVTIYSESMLDYWNNWFQGLVCTCGSDKIGHPGHSEWCDKILSF